MERLDYVRGSPRSSNAIVVSALRTSPVADSRYTTYDVNGTIFGCLGKTAIFA